MADEHVWRPILDSRAHVLYIGGTEGDYAELKRLLGSRRWEHPGERFGEQLGRIQSRLEEFAALQGRP
jgi:hypothetical protein